MGLFSVTKEYVAAVAVEVYPHVEEDLDVDLGGAERHQLAAAEATGMIEGCIRLLFEKPHIRLEKPVEDTLRVACRLYPEVRVVPGVHDCTRGFLAVYEAVRLIEASEAEAKRLGHKLNKEKSCEHQHAG